MSVLGDQTRNGAPADLPALVHPLEEGWTLPAAWYSDAAVLTAERERIFASTWQYAGWTEQVARPGSYFSSVAGHVPIIVTRDAGGTLHGLVNVCRHRGHIVADGAGCRSTLQCPYHAWTYELDGTLRRAPRSEREAAFDASERSLLPVAVDTWGPFVFANPDPDAAPLAEALGDLPGIVAESGVDVDALRFHSHEEWDLKVNWKVALENYLECYHCAVAHPGFSKVIDVDPDAYRLVSRGLISSQIGPVREAALAGRGALPYDPRGEVRQSQYHLLWPNTTINIAPGPQNVSIERWVPAGERGTLEVTDYFFGPDVSDELIRELIAWDSQVAEEDVALVEGVQRGLDSRTVLQGRLMTESEQLIAAFQRRVLDSLAGNAELAAAAAAGE